MSNNNNKQPLDLTESLLVFDKAQAPSTTRVQSGEASTTTPTVNELDYEGISLVERRSRDVKPREKNDSLGISGINQPDVTTPNLSHADELTIGLLLDCAERGEKRGNKPSPSICKVSRILRDLSESSFIPQLVSIGPIHREDPKLKEFEWQKKRYLDNLLKRCRFPSTPKETLEACLLKVKTLIPKIRESYAGVKKNYSDSELARMMVMDGCFILEFCFKHQDQNLYFPNKMQIVRIAMDLMLLENQVPFFVLQALFDCSIGKQSCTLSKVLDTCFTRYIKLFNSQFREEIPTTHVASNSTHDHVLGYLHRRNQLVVDSDVVSVFHDEALRGHTIVELDRYGVNIKPTLDKWPMTIEFQPSLFPSLPWSATLLMPTLVIDDTTELILRNFIAYEQSFPQGRYYFTSYAHAMDMLIDTQEDIAKLVESKVLVNMLGTNQEAADMINRICRNISITEFYYTQEFKQIDKHFNGFWANYNAVMRRIYDSDPSIGMTVLLFYLTVVQTIYTIRAA